MDTSQYWDYASYAVFFFSQPDMFQSKPNLKFEVTIEHSFIAPAIIHD